MCRRCEAASSRSLELSQEILRDEVAPTTTVYTRTLGGIVRMAVISGASPAGSAKSELMCVCFSSCPPLHQPREEAIDFSRGQIRAFVVHKVTRILSEGNLDLSE